MFAAEDDVHHARKPVRLCRKLVALASSSQATAVVVRPEHEAPSCASLYTRYMRSVVTRGYETAAQR